MAKLLHLRNKRRFYTSHRKDLFSSIEKYKSKMSFSSLRFGYFCDFCPKVCFLYLDPKGLKSCHFHPTR
ncbi:hypothetical protein Hanom_Chr15g01414171 [Helianthus anomalus]